VKKYLPTPPGHASERNPTLPDAAPPHHWSLPEVRIVVSYFILASVWIVGSDWALTLSSIDHMEGGILRTLKGLNFVITTAFLMFFVLRHAYSGWRLAEQQRVAGIGHAHEKFRKLSSHVQTLREADRSLIAREIHDELGQLLTGIQMQLRLIENRLADREDRTLNPLIDKLVETSELVNASIASVQRIAAGLRPSVLDDLGLASALKGEAEQFSQRVGMPCTVAFTNLPNDFPPEIATAVFRTFQESLTNVARHARAQRIDASLSHRENTLKLVVHDDGKGIDLTLIEDPKSLGLLGMLERAENVGGQVVFSRHPEQGTNVILTLPLPVTHSPD
jgi:signal transduction histidine kinase